MNVNADALSRNPIINEERSRNLHEDDDDTFMTSQEKMKIENAVIKINQENNIKRENTSKNKYFNSVFAKMMRMTLVKPQKDQYSMLI